MAETKTTLKVVFKNGISVSLNTTMEQAEIEQEFSKSRASEGIYSAKIRTPDDTGYVQASEILFFSIAMFKRPSGLVVAEIKPNIGIDATGKVKDG